MDTLDRGRSPTATMYKMLPLGVRVHVCVWVEVGENKQKGERVIVRARAPACTKRDVGERERCERSAMLASSRVSTERRNVPRTGARAHARTYLRRSVRRLHGMAQAGLIAPLPPSWIPRWGLSA